MIVKIFALKITYECEPGQHAVRFHKILPHKFLKYPEDIVSGFARIFFGGGGPWSLNGYHVRPHGALWLEVWMETKLKIINRFKVLENDFIFQNFKHLSCPKHPLFLNFIKSPG